MSGDPHRPRWVARERAVSRRVMFEGRITKVVDYFGGAGPEGGVQAYVVQQLNYVLRPHFHPVDQFQVLFGAAGSRFGRHPISTLAAHYADAYTVYGPLAGGDPPLRYLTLRAEPSEATSFMPESRGQLPQRRAGRSLHADIEPLLAGPPESGSESATVTALEDTGDGMRVLLLTGRPGAQVTVPEPGGGGQFLFVAAGSLQSDGDGYARDALAWHAPGSPSTVLTAGVDGLRLLVLTYPTALERRP